MDQYLFLYWNIDIYPIFSVGAKGKGERARGIRNLFRHNSLVDKSKVIIMSDDDVVDDLFVVWLLFADS